MISNSIKLNGESLASVMIPRETPEIAEALYKEVADGLIGKFHPFLAQFLENEKLIERTHACKTIEEVEKLDVNIVYPSLFSDLAGALDEDERLTDTERAFILTMTADRMISGAQDFFTQVAHQRCQAIAAQPKGNIITMDRPSGKKIIT